MKIFDGINDMTIMQGDILFDIPVFNFSEMIKDYEIKETGRVCYNVKVPEKQPLVNIGVILNNTCELVQSNTNRVFIAPAEPFKDYKERNLKTMTVRGIERELRELDQGMKPSKYFMRSCDVEDYKGIRFVVDFHKVFMITRGYAYKIIEKLKSPRLRLRSPFREHLAQAFGYYFGRVSLPD